MQLLLGKRATCDLWTWAQHVAWSQEPINHMFQSSPVNYCFVLPSFVSRYNPNNMNKRTNIGTNWSVWIKVTFIQYHLVPKLLLILMWILRNTATNVTSMFTRTCRLFSIVVTSSWLSWRHQNMWATLITGATLHEATTLHWASFPKIYRFQQAKPIRKLTIQIGLVCWNRKIYENLAHKFHVKFFLFFCRKSCPHLGRWLNANLNGQIVIVIWRIRSVVFDVISEVPGFCAEHPVAVCSEGDGHCVQLGTGSSSSLQLYWLQDLSYGGTCKGMVQQLWSFTFVFCKLNSVQKLENVKEWFRNYGHIP